MSELTGKKVLILAGPDYEDSELIYPRFRFIEAGAEVIVAGLGEKTYTGKRGTSIDVDKNIDDCVNTQWDIVIAPGGWSQDKVRMNQNALEIVRKTADNGEAVVAAICHGAWTLASANVVNGKTVTSYPSIKDDLINAGATWVDEEACVDGNIVTSRTPDDLPAFCKTIIGLMVKKPAAV